jgi:hypothetical protein
MRVPRVEWRRTCHVCWRHPDTSDVENIHFHHVSYRPEVQIPVCKECHKNIHSSESPYPEFLPELSRGDVDVDGSSETIVSVYGLENGLIPDHVEESVEQVGLEFDVDEVDEYPADFDDIDEEPDL